MGENQVRAAGSWVIPVNAIIGVWLIVGEIVMPHATGGRPTGVMLWHDIIVGLVVLAMCGLAMNSRSAIPFWVQCALGAWLLIAPSVLPESFLNEGLHDMVLGIGLAIMALMGAVQRSATGGTPDRV